MVKNYDKDIMPIGWAKDAYGIKNWISMDRYKAFTKENNVDLINDSIEKINNSIERNSIQKKGSWRVWTWAFYTYERY